MKKLLLVTMFSAPLSASEMVYQPKNPVFGGNPLNGSHLLNRAQSQNTHKDPASLSSRDPLENFEDTLTRQILNQVSRRILDQAFGTGELEAGGLFVYGDFQIEIITTNPDFITVRITNDNTGETTELEIPVFTGG